MSEPPGDGPKTDAAQGTRVGPHRDVFVSYASQDAAVANAIVEALEKAGLQCWIAPRDVVPGEFYAGAIVHAIDATKAIVLVLSQSAAGSQHVIREVERASSRKHPVVSFRIDLAPMPADLEYFLNTSQWLDASASGADSALPKLVDAVRRIVTPASAFAPVTGHSLRAATSATPAGPSASVLTAATPRVRRTIVAIIAVTFAYFIVDKFWLSKRVTEEQPVATATSVAAVGNPPMPSISTKSVAVLPFVDMSEKKDQEYFSDGLSEELIDMLTKVPELRVPARTSSFYFKGKSEDIPTIARRLMVAHVLEGSVRKAGGNLRITAQLVRADNGYHLWSETYDRKVDNIFKVQDEIAAAVVAALTIHLLPSQRPTSAHRTASTDAYNQYLIGQQHYYRDTLEGYRRAVESYRNAVNLDPRYASAYAGLAQAETALAGLTDFSAGFQRALAAADKAIALDPDLADRYAARGRARSDFLSDFPGAQADFERAVAINQSDSHIQRLYGQFLATVGRASEAEAAFRKAADLDPLSSQPWSECAYLLLMRKRFAEAREAVRRALDINPDSLDAQTALTSLELAQGHGAEALAASRNIGLDYLRLAYTAMAEHTLDHSEESKQALGELEARAAHGAAYQIAEVYAWRGDKRRAFEWLERAYLQHDAGLTYLKTDFVLEQLRGDKEFKEFVRKMKLPES
jgi:TolB-like protein